MTLMGEISAIASSAVAANQAKVQENIILSLLKMDAQSEQAVANMVAQNARQVEALSGNLSGGSINLFA
jgi:hypothetical protein